MKKLLILIVLFTSFGFVNAQTEKQVEVKDRSEIYVGYQFVRTDPKVRNFRVGFDSTTDSSGINTSYTFYDKKLPVGVTAELAGNFSGGQNTRQLYTGLVGATVKLNRSGRVQPFGRALFGAYSRRTGQVLSRNLDTTSVGIAVAYGAGLDVKISRKFSLRLIQVDYLATKNKVGYDSNVRFGSGIVW